MALHEMPPDLRIKVLNEAKRIAKKMRFYASQKDPLKFAKRLTDYYDGEYRFRIGEYRLTFDVKKDAIYILGVKARDKSYK